LAARFKDKKYNTNGKRISVVNKKDAYMEEYRVKEVFQI